MRRAGIRATVAVALAALAGGLDAQEDGASAAPGRWTTTGGCAARTGASESAPLLGSARVAWRYEPAGTIESEPLVWDGRVLLAVHERGTSRQLVVLDLDDGSVLASERVRGATPLAPALEDDLVVVRAAANELHTYRIEPGRLAPAAKLVGRGPFSAPLVFDGDLYAREGDRIACWPLLSAEPRWIEEGSERYRGTPSLRGDRVYAVKYDGDGRAFLVTLLRADGHSSADVLVAHHGGRVPAADAELDVFVLDEEAFVRFPLPLVTREGERVLMARVERGERGFAMGRPPTFHAYGCAPLALPDGWLARELGLSRGVSWTAVRPAKEGFEAVVLAAPDSHAELLAWEFPPSCAGDVGYLGNLAFRLAGDEDELHEVLWRAPVEPAMRFVPVDEGVLVVAADGALVCLRGSDAASAEQPSAVELAIERELAEGWSALAKRALDAGDPELVERFLREAAEAGGDARALASVRERLERMRAARKPPKRDEALSGTLAEEASELQGLPVRRLFEASAAAADPARERALLRALLARDPGHERALERLRSELPAGIEVTPESAGGWLDVLDARVPVEVVLPPAGDASGLARTQRVLGRESEEWRPDLVGIESARLLIVAPRERPAGIARCLAVGELLCDVLEELFAGPARRGDLPPLTLYLHEDEEEYVAESQRRGSQPEVVGGVTLGHYDPGENVSRMVAPAGAGALQRMLGTYAHELTHHWLQMRCPLFSAEETQVDRLELPGYWVAEGFATFVEELELDPANGTWSTGRRSPSLDLVANATAEQLIPWAELFALTRPDFGRLRRDDQRQIKVSWRLGAFAAASEANCFYAQAGAVCRYLEEAEDGALRQALRDYVRAWYTGDREALDVARAFGASPDALGARVVAWARERVD